MRRKAVGLVASTALTWLVVLFSGPSSAQQKVSMPVPPSVQKSLGKDIGRSYVYLSTDPRRSFLYVVGEQPSITKRSFLLLIQATRELARRPEFSKYKDLRVWHIRIVEAEDPENYVSFVFDPRRLDEMVKASDAAFFLGVDYILSNIGGQLDTYEVWSGKPPNVEVQPDLEKRKRLLKELGL